VIDGMFAAFAADGRALILGGVDAEGAPHATRGWGFRLDPDDIPCVVLDADDRHARACLAVGRPIAVTAADVVTLRSLQFKGITLGLVDATASDRTIVDHYIDRFFSAIVETDGTDRAVLERITPTRFALCRFRCDSVFDQTPGPDAGISVAAAP
jgi:hypothetical protein